MTREEVATAIRNLIVERLHLRISPNAINDDQPLFGEGLGLDSVEALEIVVALEERFGIVVKDTEDVKDFFYSVDTLTTYVLGAVGHAGQRSVGHVGN